MKLGKYLEKVKIALASYSWVKSIDVVRCNLLETADESILLYRFRLMLINGDFAEMMERIVENSVTRKLTSTTYSFHWQDKGGKLIKRWDNCPHFPDLEGFPHHVHLASGKVVPGKVIFSEEFLLILDSSFRGEDNG